MGFEVSSPNRSGSGLDGAGTLTLGPQPLVLNVSSALASPILPRGIRSAWAAAIPYVSQRHADGERMCGAAALAMALHSLGAPCTMEELWSEIAYPDGQGELAARTHHLAVAALWRGVPALIVQVRDGWRSLFEIAQRVPAIILNHRLSADSWQGHFTVLADMNERFAVLHDPQHGPARRVSRQQLDQLWRIPCDMEDEIAGQVLVALGPRSAHPERCEMCAMRLAPDVTCGHCGHHFPLQPAAALGCMRRSCGRCLWQKLFCPYCDAAYAPLG